jgi:hypothetical protein
MGTGKLPSFQFYPGDWQRDPVSGCSLAAQGLWLRMMLVMHDSDRYGYLSINGVPMPPDLVAARCGTILDQYTTLLAELDRAGVPSRNDKGIIFSRRMVRDAKIREIARKNGLKGGNPRLNPPVNPPDIPHLKRKGKMKISPEGEGSGERANGDAAPTRADRIAAMAGRPGGQP